MKRAIIYTRVSTDDQAVHGYSLNNQKDVIERYCKQNNFQIIKHYEEDYSAKDFERPEFKNLMEFCKKEHKSIDILLFTRWDRFSRNIGECYAIFKQFGKLGIEINSIEQPTEDEPTSKLMRGIHLMIGEMEREVIAKRTKEGMRRAMKEGYWVGKPPKGYDRAYTDQKKPTLKKNNDSKIIAKIFKEFSSGLHSAEFLRRKYYSKLKLSKQAFYNMLKSPVYTGQILLKEYKDEKAELFLGLHSPIITKDTFDLVQNLFNKNKKIKIIKNNPHFVLRGHLICNKCSNKLTASFSTGRSKKKYPYYHCQNGCKVRYKTSKADAEFVNFLEKFELKPEMKELLTRIIHKGIEESKKSNFKSIKSVDENININYNRLQNISDKYVDGEISKNEYDQFKSKYDTQIKDLIEKKQSLKLVTKTNLDYLESSIGLLSKISSLYTKVSYSLKQKLIGSIFSKSLVFDGENYRTNKLNNLVKLIFLKANELQEIGKEKAGEITRLSSNAPPLGLEPRTL